MMTNNEHLSDTSVLNAMVPGREYTLDAVCDALVCLREERSEVLIALERLNNLNAECREVSIREAIDLADRIYWRPIVVGMGATYSVGSDRYACTVIAVSPSGHKVTVQDDTAVRIDGRGMSDHQEYRYERDPDGWTRTFYRDSLGNYGNKTKSDRLCLGRRAHYVDPSF